jgi:hypothetical protein
MQDVQQLTQFTDDMEGVFTYRHRLKIQVWSGHLKALMYEYPDAEIIKYETFKEYQKRQK